MNKIISIGILSSTLLEACGLNISDNTILSLKIVFVTAILSILYFFFNLIKDIYLKKEYKNRVKFLIN